MTRIIVLANQKGGVGKTTTTLNLGAALANRGRRVLLVDLDPQSNLTTCLGFKQNGLDTTTYYVLHHPERGATSSIHPARERIDVIPATLEMAAAEVELVGKIGRELLLREALAPVQSRYDYILIDPPPSLGLFTLNGLAAATEVLIPLQAHPLALKGLGHLQKTIMLMQKLNPAVVIGGIVCTMLDQRVNLDKQVEKKIRERARKLVYTAIIPQNVRLAEASALGLTIFEHDASCAGAQAYRALAEEVDNGTA